MEPSAPALTASGDHRPVHAITAATPTTRRLVANQRRPPLPPPCRCVWLPAAALIVRAALPDHRTGATETSHPALALFHEAFQKSVRETISLDALPEVGIVEALRNGVDAGEIREVCAWVPGLLTVPLLASAAATELPCGPECLATTLLPGLPPDIVDTLYYP